MEIIPVTPRDFVEFVRRRRIQLMLAPLVILILASVGAFFLPDRYESSTTILVQRDELLNPLVSFQMAIFNVSEDRLKTFNEIIYSRSCMKALIDSLSLQSPDATEAEAQELIGSVRRDVKISRQGSDSFTISYLNEDPHRAQQGTLAVSNYFISTILENEKERDENSVAFFEQKLFEYRDKYEASQQHVVNLIERRIEDLPTEGRTLYGSLDGIDREIRDIDNSIAERRRAREILRFFPASVKSGAARSLLYELSDLEVAGGNSLRPLVSQLDEYLRKYTPQHPDVVKLEGEIESRLQGFAASVDSEIESLVRRRQRLEQSRTNVVEELKRYSQNQKIDVDSESDYALYRRMYDEMKMKYEQALMTRDLGKKGAERFVIIDPAIVPAKPSKPNRPLIIAAGVTVGMLVGLVLALVVEFLDTRIRGVRDIEVYGKRVIAYLPEVSHKNEG